ncbi:unnamed protein product, partial [Rotaria sordida]
LASTTQNYSIQHRAIK